MKHLHRLKCDNGYTLLRYTHTHTDREDDGVFIFYGGAALPFDVDVDRTSTGGTATGFPSTERVVAQKNGNEHK